MKLPAGLGKMVGPLPVAAWIGVVGAGLGLAYMTRKKDGGEPATAPADDGSFAPSGSTVSPAPIQGGAVVLPGPGANGGGGPAPPPPDTNEEWARLVAIQLIGRGFGAYATQQALAAYLEGRQLTAEQAAIVEAALRSGGPPPFSPVLAPTPAPPAAPTKPGVPPPPAPTPPPPAPATPVSPSSCPAIPPDLAGKIQSGGESVVGVLHAPGGGCWYLGSFGGVFAMGAPFYGSARPHGFGPPGDRRAVQIAPLGKGYRVISNRGEFYDFPG